ncbi:MAG TPA: hypothetical protein VF266_11080 [Thermoanaerobaculia bacterium]
MAEAFFRELRGDYVENVGQVVAPREYLDYLEPLGSALSRQPDGAGGPFVYQFRGSGGRVVGAMGWVVSAASKRYGGWNLWGLWTDGPIPALALPLFWPELQDAGRLPSLLRRANDDAGALQRRESWPELLDRISAMRLHDDDFRNVLKSELTRLYAAPPGAERPLEIDLDPASLDLLPWIYLLGPVEPGLAQLQPSRFNGAGYQYILTGTPPAEGEVSRDVETMVDTTAGDVLQGFRMAAALRERRARPRPRQKTIAPPVEKPAMPKSSPPPPPPRRPGLPPDLLANVLRLVMIALLAWIGWNVHQMRRTTPPATAQPVTTTTETQPPPLTREQRLIEALSTRPPQGMQIQPAALDDLPRTAIEIFLRRNNCFARTEPVDGKFSAAEQRAIRTCRSLATQRLMRTGIEPNDERALAWLETAL